LPAAGCIYALAREVLVDFAARHGVPVAETQAGKGALAWDHPSAMGAIGVTGGTAANALAAEADVIVAVGTRLSDFTTASRSLFRNPSKALVQLNTAGFDAAKHGALPLVADARAGLGALDHALSRWSAPPDWTTKARRLAAEWNETVTRATAFSNAALPSDAQVLGAVNRAVGPRDVIVCAAGGLPGELHKLWRCREAGTYHVEYGYSCMGYEIAGGLGTKIAMPDREVWVLVGDGSYLMMNSEIATSVMLDKKLNIVVLDNGGFGCIDRLQRSCGGASFNNLFANGSGIDFAGHAASLGALSRKVASLAELERALPEARAERRTSVIVIATDPTASTGVGGAWWDVAVPEVSSRAEVALARAAYNAGRSQQRLTG
jgi:3D-(3,5/4)-trihydroxycyclohexane-1,2-dione acylhydrolase (decyclizing)